MLVANECDIKKTLEYCKILEKELNISIYIKIDKGIGSDSICSLSEIFTDLLKVREVLLVEESALNCTNTEEGFETIGTEWVNRNCSAPAA